MVDMESHYNPPSPLDDSVLDSPLCRDFIGGIEDLQDISQSIDEDALSTFEMTENQSSGLGSGSESSTALGTNRNDENVAECVQIRSRFQEN